jgi:hypothetical protein
MWKEATRIYSTWRSEESSGYWDLHRRELRRTSGCWTDWRRTCCALLGVRLRNEAAGDSLDCPLTLSCDDDGNEDGIENFSVWESPVGVLAGKGLDMLYYGIML